MLSSVSSMMGMQANPNEMFEKLEGMRATIEEVNKQFKDPVRRDALRTI